MSKLVFVYGTLKRGHGNNRLLQSAKFIGEAVTCEDTFLMYSNGGFPYVLKNGKFFVKGEVFEVTDKTTESNLDFLEGVPNHYVHHPVSVRLKDEPECLEAVMYVASDRTADRARRLTPILPNDQNVLEWV